MYLKSFFIFLVYLNAALAQDVNCDFLQNVEAGRVYNFSSPGYPANYPAGVQCRWTGVCPVGYNCRVDCFLELPQTTSCSLDRLMISRTGDPMLTGADVYCGRGTVSAVSTAQKIIIGLITARTSPRGRFFCQMSAQIATPPVNCQCGARKQNRIVGGQETGINEFTMMVGLVDVKIRQIKCGATMISSRYVLTAAHCLTMQSVNNVLVLVGEHDVNAGESPATKGYKVARFIIHPQFIESNYDYDIALVEVAEPIIFSDRVGPVCLPFKFLYTNFTGAQVMMLGCLEAIVLSSDPKEANVRASFVDQQGAPHQLACEVVQCWGTLYPGGPTSNVLRKVTVDVISDAQCRTRVPTLTDRQICTLTPGKDACQDDSGGPVLYTDPVTGRLFNLGIVSYGRSCASMTDPGVSTKITALLNWIVTTTKESYCYM